MPFSGEYPQYSNESPKKKRGEGEIGAMAEPAPSGFLAGGRLVIHVMDSLDSPAAAPGRKSAPGAVARWHGLGGEGSAAPTQRCGHRVRGGDGGCGTQRDAQLVMSLL